MTAGWVEAVNVGEERPLSVRGTCVGTGIFKMPRRGPQRVEASGLSGDVRVEPRKYGAEYHAVHAYPAEHFGYWAQRFGRGPFEPGALGENLTVRGALETDVRLGDVVACGSALLVVSQPRIPCRKLTARVGIEAFARHFLESLRVGYYLRVERPGQVAAGDPFVVVDTDSASPTVADFVRISQLEYWDHEGLETLVAARGLPPAWRPVLIAKLERAREAWSRGSWFGTRTLRVLRRDDEDDGAPLTLSLECPYGRSLPEFGPGQRLLVIVGTPQAGVRVFGSLTQASEQNVYRVALRLPDGENAATFAALGAGARVRCIVGGE